MRTAAIVLIVFLCAAQARAEPPAEGCAACHSQLQGALRVEATGLDEDVHARVGVRCAECHGGDSGADSATAAHSGEYRGTPRGKAVLDMCGGCHANAGYMKRFDPSRRVDQIAQYVESGHGKRLLAGDDKTATCVSCHGAHGIRSPRDPESPVFAKNVPSTCGKCHGDAKFMEGRERPTDIVEKYRSSVHGRALLENGNLRAPACNSCHGSHGAEKPRADSVANVCGKCHEAQARLFRETKKRAVFDAGGSPECVVCHARHATRPTNDQMLGLGPESLCAECHSEPDDVGRKDAQRLAAAFSAVGARIESTDSYLAAGLRDGVDVREEVTRLDGARSHIAQARVLVHGFDTQRILDEVYSANRITESVRADGETRVWRTKTRRWLVYAGVAAGVLLCLGLFLALWTRVREADSTWQRGRERQPASNDA